MGGGGIAGQCCPLRYRALWGGGIAAILSQIAAEWVTKFSEYAQHSLTFLVHTVLAWPPLQSLAVKKNFFLQILVGEKLLKVVEKCR